MFDNLVYYFVNLVVYPKDLPMSVVTAAAARRTETPNATMTTCASPTLGSTSGLSLWRVQMRPAARGPAHTVDSEQLLTVLRGTVTVDLGDTRSVLRSGDTIVLAPDVVRQITAESSTELLVCGHGDAIVSVPGEDAPRGTPPWIA
jgi:quercetin dioxygenase-like cupin family protein